MNALGIVFSNIHDDNVRELTDIRTMASIPFGGRYRLIDFVLSNMINSGVTRVGVITKHNYRSLMDHVGSGKDWDLARKNGGLILLPPFGETESNSLYGTRLEALKTVSGFIMRASEEYLVMSDSNAVFSQNFNDMFEQHVMKNADVTMMYVKKKAEDIVENDNVLLTIDSNDRIKDVSVDAKAKGDVTIYGNVCIIKRSLLISLLSDAVAHGKRNFVSDVLCSNLTRYRVFGYHHSGYFEEISSLRRFYNTNMGLLNPEIRNSLFGEAEIYTKIKDSAPTKYGASAIVKNSLVSDGCEIHGEVYNSVLFRGVKVGRGTVVKNCILMQDTITGENVSLNCIIADKQVVIRDRRVLSGSDNYPFYIPKDSII